MKINSIKIENFLSIKSMVINFDDYSGITRVIGENKDTTPVSSNGAGKSALIEAISFGLFGKTLRKTSERSIINKYTSGKCRVTLTINENVVIERTKKAPKLIFTVGGKNYTHNNPFVKALLFNRVREYNPSRGHGLYSIPQYQ
jgi:recombinational DNA repair ATPase RecF